MIQKIKEIYKSIQSLDANRLIYLSIFIILAGFLLNGCILKICGSKEFILYKLFDNLLFIIEGAIIAATLMILLAKHPKRIIGIYVSLGIIFVISIFIFPQNKESILSITKEFFLYCVTSFILFWEVSKDKKLYDNIMKIARITFFLGLIYLILLLINNEKLYNLWISRFFFFTGIFNLYSIYKSKNNRAIIISIINFIAIFITGSRTYLILYSSFAIALILIAIIKKVNKLTSKNKVIAIVIIAVVMILLSIIIINYKQICDNLFYFFAEKGITIRVFRLLATDNFFTSNDRINIMYPTVSNLIRENWIIGLGIGGDRTALYNLYEQVGNLRNDVGIGAYYSHNLFLEIYSNFGILLGTIIFGFIIYGCYKIVKSKQNISAFICLFFIAIMPLMLTGTIWNNVYFWALFGMIFASFQKNSNIEEKKEKKDVVMLLDNCFDPDVRVHKEAKYLVDNGINVEIVCLDKKNKYKDKPVENFEGIKIKRIFCRTKKITKIIEKNKIISKCKHIIYFWWLLKFIYKAKKYLQEKDFEILHCHDLVMAFIGCAFFNNKKIVFDMHEYYLNRGNKVLNYFISKIVKYVQNRATWIVHVNNFQLNDMESKNKEKLVFIPNYPEESQFKNYNHIYSDYIRINYTGYVRHYIPLLNLMKAVNDIEGIKVSINGSGECYDSLKKIEATMKNSTLTGEYKHDDILKFYENSDITYVVYNKGNKNDETAFPTKFYESMILCIPVIVSKDTLMAEFVEKNNIGFIVDGTNYLDIKNVLLEILNDRESLIQKSNNMKKISQNYIWENIVKNLNCIYVDCDTKSKN